MLRCAVQIQKTQLICTLRLVFSFLIIFNLTNKSMFLIIHPGRLDCSQESPDKFKDPIRTPSYPTIKKKKNVIMHSSVILFIDYRANDHLFFYDYQLIIIQTRKNCVNRCFFFSSLFFRDILRCCFIF